MLKPYLCVACEKVIIGKDNIASLISLFSKMTVTVQPGNEPPSNAVVPREWFVFSIWETGPGDETRGYDLVTQILYPDGAQFGEIAKQRLAIEPGKRAQVTVQVPGFPVGQIGDYSVKTWIEENQKIVLEPIVFRLGVEWLRQEPSSAAKLT